MTDAFNSALYRGELMHARHDELARRAFRYPVYMAALDLDEVSALDESLWLFSHRGPNLFAFDERDYAATLAPNMRVGMATSAPNTRDSPTNRAPTKRASTNRASTNHDPSNRASLTNLRDGLAALRAANGLPAPHTTRLVTNLRVAGYVFNPVSFFLDYDATGELTSVIAEVNNTYGGRLRYVLGPNERIAASNSDNARPRGREDSTTDNARPRGREDSTTDNARPRGREDIATADDDHTRPRGRNHIATSDNVQTRPPRREDSTTDNARPRGREDGTTDNARPRGREDSTTDNARPHGRERIGFRHRRELFVSPFLHGDATYEFWFDAPLDADSIAIEMNVFRDDARIFTARFDGSRRAMSDRTLAAAALRYPFMTAQVIGLIHLEALKLRRQGVPYRRPRPDHRPLALR